jgi:hypothetical protein
MYSIWCVSFAHVFFIFNKTEDVKYRRGDILAEFK